MEPVLVSLQAGVLRITLNRPEKLNAFNPAVHKGLADAMTRAETDGAIRCLLITGAGRGFCAGQDLQERDMKAAAIDLGGSLETWYNPLVKRMRALPKPIVCAVNGVAVGGGANFALACDIVLAARSASFIQAFVKIGLVPDCGGSYFLPRLSIPRGIVWATQVALILIICGNSFLLSRVEAWSQTGWAGPDAEEIQVVDAVAKQIRADGKDRASIGYQTFIFPFMAQYHITNPIYKVGAEFDMLFYYRHNIVNTNRCAEGLAPGDEYLIVQTRPKPPEWAPKHYFELPLDSQFHLVDEIESYQLFKKD